MTIQDERREGVRTQAARLDEVLPGWAAKIDRGRLNLADGCNCILGQLYGDYCEGMAAILGRAPDVPRSTLRAFNPYSGPYRDWPRVGELESLWLAEVAARVGGGAS